VNSEPADNQIDNISRKPGIRDAAFKMEKFREPAFLSRETRDSRALRQKTLKWLAVDHRMMKVP
jgi:hypothetical protein